MILPKRDSGTLRRRPCAIKILKSPCPRHGKKKFAEDSSQNQTGNPSPELLCFPDDKAQLTDSSTPPRAPVNDLEDSLKLYAFFTIDFSQAVSWNRVKMVTNSDTTILTLLNTTEQGFPEAKQNLSPSLQKY